MTDYVEEMNRYYRDCAPWHDYYMNADDETVQKLLAPLVDTVTATLADRDVLEIACGTGNWTRIAAGGARRVTAVDINPEMIERAGEKLRSHQNVSLHIHDAYRLDTFAGKFTAALAVDWWSHIPIQLRHDFLNRLQTRLEAGSPVIFIDMTHRTVLDGEGVRADVYGNRVCRRRLPNGKKYWVIKNFPDEEEMRECLRRFGNDVEYIEYDDAKRWLARCRSL